MINVTPEFKAKVLTALLAGKENFDGSEKQYAQRFNINSSVYSRLKNGEDTDGLIKDSKWMEIGMKLNVALHERKWVTVATQVYNDITEIANFCQLNGKSYMLVDATGIGKTYTAKALARQQKNCFYIDGSQAKGKIDFVRLFAASLGLNPKDKLIRIKAAIKYYLKVIPNPLIIIDEAGDLDDRTFLEIKEIWNDTEGQCGWLMMGADGLQNKVERNINNRKPGFAEIFSRFGERYNHITPLETTEKQQFYKHLITQVVSANIDDKSKVKEIVNKCLRNDSGKISGLRRAETLILIS